MDDKEFAEIEELYREAADEDTPDLWSRIEKKIVEEESRAAEEEFLRERSHSDDTVGMTGMLKNQDNPDGDTENSEEAELETKKIVSKTDGSGKISAAGSDGLDSVGSGAGNISATGSNSTAQGITSGNGYRDSRLSESTIGRNGRKSTRKKRYMWKVVGLVAVAACLIILAIPPILHLSNRTRKNSTSSDYTMNVASDNAGKKESTGESIFASDTIEAKNEETDGEAAMESAAEAEETAPAGDMPFAAEAVEEDADLNHRGQDTAVNDANGAMLETFTIIGEISEQGGSYYILLQEMLDDSGIPAEKKNLYTVKNLQLLISKYDGFELSDYVGKTVTAKLSLLEASSQEFGNELYSVVLRELSENK